MSHKGAKTLPVINLQSQTNDTGISENFDHGNHFQQNSSSLSLLSIASWFYQLAPKKPDEFSVLPSNIS